MGLEERMIDLIRDISRHYNTENETNIAVSGWTAALSYLMYFKSNDGVVQTLKEQSATLTFGARKSLLKKLKKQFFKELVILGNTVYKVNKAEYHDNFLEETDLETSFYEVVLDKLSIREEEEKPKSITLRFYDNATIKIPGFWEDTSIKFNNDENGFFERVICHNSDKYIRIASLYDIYALEVLASDAPVVESVRKNSMIVNAFEKIIGTSNRKLQNFYEKVKKVQQRFKKETNSEKRKLLDEAFGGDVETPRKLEKAYGIVAKLLASGNKNNLYHNIRHTGSVLEYSLMFVNKYFPDFEYKEELAYAAIFHDANLGFGLAQTDDTIKNLSGTLDSLLELESGTSYKRLKDVKRKIDNPELYDNESVAAEIAAMYLKKNLGWSDERVSRVKEFINATHLGYKINQDEIERIDPIKLGCAFLQSSDIYEIVSGDIEKYLANTLNLLIETSPETQDGFNNFTLKMFSQLLNFVTHKTEHNPLFNLYLQRFVERKYEHNPAIYSELRQNLMYGILANFKAWHEKGHGLMQRAKILSN